MNSFVLFLKGLDWSPLIISLKTGIVATLICFVLGTYAAAKTVRASSKLRTVLDAVFTLPMVVPPTAVGFFLLFIFSRRRPVGAFLADGLNINVVQTWLGCIIAASVIAFPLMYRNALAAFEQVDSNLVYVARTLGISEKKIFLKIIMPNAASGIYSGIILTFTRAIGEFGATAMLAGNIAGRTGTIAQKIAMVIQDGDYTTAGFYTAVVVIIAIIFLLSVNLLFKNSPKSRKW